MENEFKLALLIFYYRKPPESISKHEVIPRVRSFSEVDMINTIYLV
jgi:hypothetical protein